MEHAQLVTQENGLSILKPFDIQKEELQKWANDYKNLVVTKDTYEDAIKARKVLRDARLKVAGILKENKSVLNSEKSKQEEKAAELIAITEPIEEKIDAGIKAIDEEKRIEKERKEKEAMVKIQSRTNQLHELGMKLSGDTYSLGEHSVNALQIKVFSDEEYNELLELVKTEALIIENARIEEENKRKEELLLLEKQKQEQEAERKRLELLAKEQEAKQMAFERQQEQIRFESEQKQKQAEKELADKQAEFQKIQNQEQEMLRKQKEELLNAIKDSRTNQLYAIGLTWRPSEDSFVFGTIAVAMVDLVTSSEKEWTAIIEDITPIAKALREEAELKIKEASEAKQKQQEEEERLALERTELLKSDVEKLEVMIIRFNDIEYVQGLKDAKSQQILTDVMKMNEGIQEYIRLAIKNL